MANLCDNDVILYGPQEAINRFVEVALEVGKEQEIITPEAIQKKLGFECSNWGRSYDSAMGALDWYRDGETPFDTSVEGQVKFYCTTAWNDIRDYWSALCDFLGLDGFATRSEEGEIWVYGDSYGTFFSENYLFDNYQGCYEYFDTAEELTDYLNSIYGENHSYDEWVAKFNGGGYEEGIIKEITRE